jgi:hypothetical protein
MSDIAARLHTTADQIAAEGMILRAADVRAGAIEIERLRAAIQDYLGGRHKVTSDQHFRRALWRGRNERRP